MDEALIFVETLLELVSDSVLALPRSAMLCMSLLSNYSVFFGSCLISFGLLIEIVLGSYPGHLLALWLSLDLPVSLYQRCSSVVLYLN